MEDYIKREDAITELRKRVHRFTVADEIGCTGTVKWSEEVIYETSAMNGLMSIPAADVVKRRHGRWIEERFLLYGGSIGYTLTCSYCDETFTETDVTIPPKEYPFCPACGASMENNIL